MKLGLISICLLAFLSAEAQIAVNVNWELHNHSQQLYDGFGASRKVLNEKRYSILLIKKFNQRLNLGFGYSFNRGIIVPYLVNITRTTYNRKNYHRLNLYGDFDFLTGKIRPYIFNNTGLIFDYPKELSSYYRTNEIALNSQFGLGVKWQFREKWNLRLQYSIGQVLGLKTFDILQNMDLFGFGVSYSIADRLKRVETTGK
ncbi:MAG: hypothetical protein ACFHWX_06340 [Bacteroidota bacterium]